MEVKVLAILPGIIPSTIIDIVTPIMNLQQDGKMVSRVTLESFVRKKDIDWCDIVLFCRNMQSKTPWWFTYISNVGKPFIYDIDDNFFDIPEYLPISKDYKESLRLESLQKYIASADLVRVYSEPMLERGLILNPNVVKVVAPIVWRFVSTGKINRRKDNIIKIVYATSRQEDYLAEIFKPALMRIIEEYSNKIEVYFLGYNPPEFNKYRNVFFKPMIFDYEAYMKSFSRAGYDIGLAPMLNDIFHRSKTNNKFREYGASNIAGIYSNVEIYSNCVKHGYTGYLVENDSNKWYQAMKKLIDNKIHRNQIQKAAYEFVYTNYSDKDFSRVWYEQIIQVLSQSRTRHYIHSILPSTATSKANYPFIFIREIGSIVLRRRYTMIPNYIKMLITYWKIQIQLRLTRKK